MTKTGGSRHLSRLAAPKTWKIARKLVHGVYTVKPIPGPHPKELSLPLGLIIRDYLGLAKTMREARKILSLREIYVDGVVRTNYKFPVGIFDIISIPKEDLYLRVVLDKLGRISLIEIPEKESNLKIGLIKRKTLVKGDKIQITTHDGRNWQFDRKEGNKFKTKDSLLFEVPNQKIIEHIKRDKGILVYLIGGAHKGELGRILEFRKYPGPQPNTVVIESLETGLKYETLEEYAIPVGIEKPLIKIK